MTKSHVKGIGRDGVEKARFALLTTVSAVALLCGATVNSFSAEDESNYWIGGFEDKDFFDPTNWSDGAGPQGENSTFFAGSAQGMYSINGPTNTNLAHIIGSGAGNEASVLININTDDSNGNSVFLNFGQGEFLLGTDGGSGTLSLELNGNAQTFLGSESVIIGQGAGGQGTLNLIGVGKETGSPPEGPYELGSSCYACAPMFHFSSAPIVVGSEEGTGTINVEGASFAFGSEGIVIGDGLGSTGTVNVLAGGKLGENYISPNGLATVGQNGGNGYLNLDGTAAASINEAPVAFLKRGLLIGSGTGSNGSANIISQGKLHSFIDYGLSQAAEFTREELDTRVGVDGGAGIVTVSGEGSVWYQSGVADTYFSSPQTINTDEGVLRVGQSGTGELVIADMGEVKIGSATIIGSYIQDEDRPREVFELSDYHSNGTLILGAEESGNGLLSIGGAQGEEAKAAGRLMAKTIEFGSGVGAIVFNHTENDYVFDQFDDQFKSGPVTPTSIEFVGTGTIEAVSGRTLLINDHAEFAGALRASGAGILQVNGDMSLAAATVLAGGVLEGTGTVGTTVNSGIIAPGQTPGATQGTLGSIGTLTIAGNYTGEGGFLSLDTVLNGDDSVTDMLVVTGDTSGVTNVVVTNVGGNGEQTVDGIKIIDVGGASEGAFNLQGDYVHEGQQAVVGGAYAYKLYQGGVATPEDGDWYLRSQLIEDEPEEPLYQAGVPAYEAYPQALLGLNGVSTLQQRTGNRVWSGNGNRVVTQGADAIGSPYAAPDEAGVAINGNGVWGRIEGSHNHMQPRFSTSDTSYNQNVFKMQAGIDGVLTETENGKLIGGFTVHYAHGKTKTNSAHGDGEISTGGYGLGGTLSWFGENGFYLDGQGQVTWYRSDLTSTTAQTSLIDGNHGFGYALSLESGKRFAINEAWSLTPQAQLTYSKVDFDTFTDVFDADVSLDRGESLQGRLGLTLDHENSWQNANGMLDRTHVYGIANLYYEFLNGTRVNVAETSFSSRNDRVWGGLGVGGSYNWNDDKYAIYGEGLINTSLNNFADSYSIKANVGFKVKW